MTSQIQPRRMAWPSGRTRDRQPQHPAFPDPHAQRKAASHRGRDRRCRLQDAAQAGPEPIPAARLRASDRRRPQLDDHRTLRRRKDLARLRTRSAGLPRQPDRHLPAAARLFADLELAHGDGSFPRLFRSLAKADLLILDDWGPDRLTAGQRRDLMEIVEERHGRGSILITSQLPVTAWHAVIDEPTFADAILDRLVHNAHRLELDGHSMRRSGSPAENVDEGQRA